MLVIVYVEIEPRIMGDWTSKGQRLKTPLVLATEPRDKANKAGIIPLLTMKYNKSIRLTYCPTKRKHPRPVSSDRLTCFGDFCANR